MGEDDDLTVTEEINQHEYRDDLRIEITKGGKYWQWRYRGYGGKWAGHGGKVEALAAAWPDRWAQYGPNKEKRKRTPRGGGGADDQHHS